MAAAAREVAPTELTFSAEELAAMREPRDLIGELFAVMGPAGLACLEDLFVACNVVDLLKANTVEQGGRVVRVTVRRYLLRVGDMRLNFAGVLVDKTTDVRNPAFTLFGISYGVAQRGDECRLVNLFTYSHGDLLFAYLTHVAGSQRANVERVIVRIPVRSPASLFQTLDTDGTLLELNRVVPDLRSLLWRRQLEPDGVPFEGADYSNIVADGNHNFECDALIFPDLTGMLQSMVEHAYMRERNTAIVSDPTIEGASGPVYYRIAPVPEYATGPQLAVDMAADFCRPMQHPPAPCPNVEVAQRAYAGPAVGPSCVQRAIDLQINTDHRGTERRVQTRVIVAGFVLKTERGGRPFTVLFAPLEGSAETTITEADGSVSNAHNPQLALYAPANRRLLQRLLLAFEQLTYASAPYGSDVEVFAYVHSDVSAAHLEAISDIGLNISRVFRAEERVYRFNAPGFGSLSGAIAEQLAVQQDLAGQIAEHERAVRLARPVEEAGAGAAGATHLSVACEHKGQ